MHALLRLGCQAGCSGRLTLHEVSLQDTPRSFVPPWHFVPGSYEPSRWDEEPERPFLAMWVTGGFVPTGIYFLRRKNVTTTPSRMTARPVPEATSHAGNGARALKRVTSGCFRPSARAKSQTSVLPSSLVRVAFDSSAGTGRWSVNV